MEINWLKVNLERATWIYWYYIELDFESESRQILQHFEQVIIGYICAIYTYSVYTYSKQDYKNSKNISPQKYTHPAVSELTSLSQAQHNSLSLYTLYERDLNTFTIVKHF